jgi:hypothetical protein
MANNGNNIRLQTVNLKAKIYILYMLTLHSNVSKENNSNFSDWWFFPFATGVVDTGGAPWAANISANFGKNLK